MIEQNCQMESHLSSLPGITATFCSVAHHNAALAADKISAAPKLQRGMLCGPSCRHMLASILAAQLCGRITTAQFDAINSACP